MSRRRERSGAAAVAWSIVALGIATVVTEVAISGLPHSVGETELGTVWAIFARLVGLTSIVMGALIVSRRPENPIGWLFCSTVLYRRGVRLPVRADGARHGTGGPARGGRGRGGQPGDLP